MSCIPHEPEEIKITPSSEAGEAPYELVGEEVQRLSVLQSLPSLLKGDSSLCMQRVVPKVQLALPNASTEFHMAASSTFLTILEKKLVHPRTFTQTFLQSILSSIESRDPVVANAWLETLLDVMNLLPSEVIRSEILPIAIAKGQISQIISSRLTACKLLGKICTRFEPYMLKKEVLPVVHSLCQDVNYEVRACICSQLKFVAKGLGPEGAKIALLSSLVELASDEESSVRLSAVQTIVEVLPHLQADVLKHTIVPLVKKLCTQAMHSEDDVLSVISHHLGQLCLGLDSYLTMSEKSWFMLYYQQLAELGLPNLRNNVLKKEFSSMMPDISSDTSTDRFIICRQNCAYNFPAMAMFSTRQGECFHEQLYSTFCDLASDPYFLVRRTIACGIHEVTSVLGPACGMLKNELVKLLRDDAEEVLQGLIPNIAKTMELLAKTGNIGPDNMDTTAIEIGRALVKCEAEISETHNWRLHSLLLAQMECLPNCLPSEFIYSHFVPIMFTRIHTARPIPCRLAAARTLLVLLRYNQKLMQKNDIRSRICTELGQGHSCYSRMMFVKLSITAMELFSQHYFKDHFYLWLLDLADDRVPNIRLQLVTQLPRLKTMLRLPTDRKLLLAVESCVRKLLMSEKDHDVVALLNHVIQELDKIEVQMEMPTAPLHLSKDDMEDQRKLDEELRLCNVKPDPTKKKPSDKKTLLVPSSTSLRTMHMQNAGAKQGFTYRGMEAKETVSKITGTSGRTSLKQTERKLPSSSNPSSITGSRDRVMSLEDEFYVDAGIRIPQQLAASDLAPFPSRIPNLKEILFKNHNAGVSNLTLQPSKISVTISIESKQNSDNPSIVNTSSEVKLLYELPSKQNVINSPCMDHVANVDSKPTNPNMTSIICKPTTAKNFNKRNLGIFHATKQHCVSSQKDKICFLDHKQKESVIASRRHSYMDGEKIARGSEENGKHNELATIRRTLGTAGNRRHSYIEKISTDDTEKNREGQVMKQGYGCNQNILSNKRHSYIESANSSTTRSIKNNEGVSFRKGSMNNVDTLNKHKSLILKQSYKSSRRVSSLDQGTDTSIVEGHSLPAAQIVKHPQSLPLVNKRRHSSLEGDVLDRMVSHVQVSPSNATNEVSDFSSLDSSSRIGKTVYKNDSSSILQNDFLHYSVSNENLELVKLRKGNNLSLSKIPRGGAASCHSSPGGSRASSPTGGSLRGNATRVRQRTAPNSRASSPTGTSGINRKGHQRLSLGSLNCYMSSLRLSDSASRLPIRKT